MSNRIAAAGSQWGTVELSDRFGGDTPDEIITKLICIVIDRFDDIALEHGLHLLWVPHTSEVLGEAEELSRLTMEEYEAIDQYRRQALADVWAAVCDEVRTEDGDIVPAKVRAQVLALDWSV